MRVPDSFGENLEAARAQARRDIMATPVAEHFPAFVSVMSDRMGHLWVEVVAA